MTIAWIISGTDNGKLPDYRISDFLYDLFISLDRAHSILFAVGAIILFVHTGSFN